MLLTFSARNYTSIKDWQTISLVGSSLKGPHQPIDVKFPGGDYGVLPCAIIYGANASGKSNMLNALISMKSMVEGSHGHSSSEKKLPRRPYLLDESYSGAPTSFDVSFMSDDVRYDFGFSFDDNEILTESLFSYPEGRRRTLYERDRSDIRFGSGMKGAKKTLAGFLKDRSLFLSTATQNQHEELSVVANFFNNIFASNRISVAADLLNFTFKKDVIDVRTIAFLDAIGTGITTYGQKSSDTPEEIKRMIADVVQVFVRHSPTEGNVDFPDPDDKQVEIELGHKSANGDVVYFPGEAESAGTRRLLVLMNSIFKVLDEGDIAVVDELDASLHTHAVEAIIQLFLDPEINTKGAQIIATTHDTNLLNPEKLRRDEIWFAEKRPDGASDYFSLAEVTSRRDEVFERAYLQGRYGAVPLKLDKDTIKKSHIKEDSRKVS